jgi:hypothetical protein
MAQRNGSLLILGFWGLYLGSIEEEVQLDRYGTTSEQAASPKNELVPMFLSKIGLNLPMSGMSGTAAPAEVVAVSMPSEMHESRRAHQTQYLVL